MGYNRQYFGYLGLVSSNFGRHQLNLLVETESYQIWQTFIPLSAKILSDWGGGLIHINSFKMRKEGYHFGYVTVDVLVGFLANLVRSRRSRVGHEFLPNLTVFGSQFDR